LNKLLFSVEELVIEKTLRERERERERERDFEENSILRRLRLEFARENFQLTSIIEI